MRKRGLACNFFWNSRGPELLSVIFNPGNLLEVGLAGAWLFFVFSMLVDVLIYGVIFTERGKRKQDGLATLSLHTDYTKIRAARASPKKRELDKKKVLCVELNTLLEKRCSRS
ncbi:MAG: hypothetical protein WKF70_04290 [Chitinophagaceae bacterium]